MPNISIDLNDPSSIDDAIKYMEQLQKDMETATKEVVETLAEEAYIQADSEFRKASYPGDNDVLVTDKFENGGKKATITATGSSVLFVEFGTGIFKSDNYEERDDVTSGGSSLVLHGFYGSGHGANHKGWVYTGDVGNAPSDTKQLKNGKVHTFGNDANSSMWKAKKYVKRNQDRIVKEVFKKYL